MEWDVKKVFTAVNANKLEIGSKIIVANNLDSLKCKVDSGTEVVTLYRLWDSAYERRFDTGDKIYPLAYFVDKPAKLTWTDLEIGDIITNGVRKYMVTGIDLEGVYDSHIYACEHWITDNELKDWRIVE